MIRYLVESRNPRASAPLAREWSVDTIEVDPALGFRSRLEADASITRTRALGPDFAAAEYRVRPVSL